jgi:hypothetical protein
MTYREATVVFIAMCIATAVLSYFFGWHDARFDRLLGAFNFAFVYFLVYRWLK